MDYLLFLTACMFSDINSRQIPNAFIWMNTLFFVGKEITCCVILGRFGEIGWIIIRYLIFFMIGFILFMIKAFGGADGKILAIVVCGMSGTMMRRYIGILLVISFLVCIVHIVRKKELGKLHYLPFAPVICCSYFVWMLENCLI